MIVGIDDITKKKVAIKMISSDNLKNNNNTLFNRLKLEIEIMARLNHPNILKLLDVIDTDRHVCVISEYASGGDLYSLVE